ncbi:hypothetical protein [Mycolicibacterium litorale]|uniref:Uncharacterized protein n=1 Tax=Mycolicibacterium litorale TaxID=758802 RepID=A0AAD1IPC2_9MYCO|nr:hypothetical protein [Mycolicibacterium litorale]MCV7417793.1 hypothetical protein [Mycolicibacterium litorale]TDY06818.1 hypothetical protein BCL50_3154 [Mycolicibacterium litorale]BBY19025.1 hypothetical protein MLIT_46170 [Mycolicibacterium litorale]
MRINPMLTDITHVRRLMDAVTECGVTPPESLSSVLDGLDTLTGATAISDPTQALIRAAFDGGAPAAEKSLAEFAVAELVAEKRKGLRGVIDPAFTQEFCDRLEAGGADEILDILRPAFDDAVAVIADAQRMVDVTADAQTVMDEASAEQLAAWQSIPGAVAKLDQIASVAGSFGPKAQSFSLVAPPHGLEFGWAQNNAVMCSAGDLINDSRAFAMAGNQPRQSAWLRVAPRLNTIAEARERVRAYAESAWASMNGHAKRGRLTDTGDVAWDPVRNPFALANK